MIDGAGQNGRFSQEPIRGEENLIAVFDWLNAKLFTHPNFYVLRYELKLLQICLEIAPSRTKIKMCSGYVLIFSSVVKVSY